MTKVIQIRFVIMADVSRYRNDPGLLEKHHSVRAFELLVPQ